MTIETLPSAPPAASLIARFEGECVVCLEEKVLSFFVYILLVKLKNPVRITQLTSCHTCRGFF